MAVDGTVISFGSLIGGLLFVFGALYKHASQRSKHPCSDSLVYTDVCEKCNEKNDQAHEHFRQEMRAGAKKSDDQHKELKGDMNRGFEEIKTLIRQG